MILWLNGLWREFVSLSTEKTSRKIAVNDVLAGLWQYWPSLLELGG
jgi:hypothetical protein